MLGFGQLCVHTSYEGILLLFQESKLEFQDGQKEPFLELHMILQALKARDLEPALR